MNNKANKSDGIKIDPKVKDVLKLLAAGAILTTVVLFPGIAAVAPLIEAEKRRRERKEWEKFNLWRLRQVIKRLESQKIVEIKDDVVKITNRGKKRLLKFNLDNIKLKGKTDGKWRLIIYDIANLKKPQRELFRETLKRLKFLGLQESVYLTPFVCDDEIEYLRQLFDIGDEVVVLRVEGIENEQAYNRYFGI